MHEDDLVSAIKEHGLVREHLPTNHLNSSKVRSAAWIQWSLAQYEEGVGDMGTSGETWLWFQIGFCRIP